MSNVRFDELELMLMAMFEQPTLRDTIQVLTEIQPLVAEDAEMAVLVQQTIQKMQQLNEQQFKGLELEWHKPDEPNKKTFTKSKMLRKIGNTAAAVMRIRSNTAL